MSFSVIRRAAGLNLRGTALRARPHGAPPPKSGSNTFLYSVIGAAALAGAGYYVYTSQDDTARSAKSTLKEGSQIAKSLANYVPTKEDYQKVYNKVAHILDVDDYDDGSFGPVLVRLAWHASGTYDKDTKTGGSNYATMRFEPESLHAANNGLDVARKVLEPIKQEFPWISYGDLWTLAGVAAVQEMQGPHIPWRPGRVDGFTKDSPPDGRLPDASKSQDHIRAIFYRMGFNDQEIVALIGAHALGRCHPNRSEFEGPWTFSPTTFTNDFFTLLANEKWQWRKWSGPKQYEDSKTKTLMMLPTDYALIQDKKFREWVYKYAKSQDEFFKDFSKAFATLLELGVPTAQFTTSEPWILKTLDEQKSG
ncbi:heme peroxidase [Cantharellus anzutake]|uniref:heme peroxidase n=1 Tax=Cantharellus anzutake TaxID=1750568 RepID=UPI00190811F6|nr:heme peroxidase [Cantharellus anzutake]KAF8342294.1 heme peroxidase [Cantharellus anzutake]